jgi:PAS domain S-box-containing protein
MNEPLSSLQNQFIKQLSDPATIFLDAEGLIVEWNERAASLFGEKIREAAGKPLPFIFGEESSGQPSFRSQLALAEKKPVVLHREWSIAGRTLRGKMHLRAVPADNGTLLGYGIIFIDLDEASEEFRSAAVESPESKAIAEIKDYAIFFLSPEGVIQTWNQGTLAIKGYTREEFVGHRFEMLFTPEDQKNGKPEEEMAKAARDGRYAGEGWRVRKDGSRFWANVVLTAVHDAGGNLVGFTKVTRDLTKHRTEEEELRMSESSYRHLVNEIDEYAIFRIGSDGHIMSWNKGVEAIKGYGRAEFIGLPFRTLFTPEDAATGRPEWELEFAKQHGRYEGEGWRRRKNGSRFWANIVLTALKNEEGQFIGWVKVTRDMSNRKKAEDQLVRAKAEADEANRMKTQFLANVSHEIRTPLGAIIGFSELLQRKDPPTPTRKEYAMAIHRNGQILAKLINEILDLSKVEAGKLEIEAIEFDLPQLIQEMNSTFSKLAKQRGLKYVSICKTALPEYVISDPTRVRQILMNLVGNALKFTEKGHVTLEIDELNSGEKEVPDMLLFTVVDSGIGIPEESRHKLFQEFSQADSSTTRKYGGTGLGLTLAKKIAKAMGGDVLLVASTPGVGSRFQFAFPVNVRREEQTVRDLEHRLPAMSGTEKREIPRRQLAGIKILVAEDVPDNQLLLKNILEENGAEFDMVASGQEAMELALRKEHALVLMDLQMPVMDGTTATRRLRELGYERPIVALSAHAMPAEKEQALRAGFDDYLTKPINQMALVKTIQTLSRAPELRRLQPGPQQRRAERGPEHGAAEERT